VNPGHVHIVNPVAAAPAQTVGTSPRPASLEDQVLGVVINGKEYSDVVLRRVAERVSRDHKLRDVLWWDKLFPAKPAPFLEEVAARSTLVLTGVGH
jgi:hypothetical protein